jgi:hypothetical protein
MDTFVYLSLLCYIHKYVQMICYMQIYVYLILLTYTHTHTCVEMLFVTLGDDHPPWNNLTNSCYL